MRAARMKERKWIYICQARLPLSPGPAKASAWLVTKALVAAGAHVVAGSRTPGKQLPLPEESGQVSFVAVDLTQPGTAEELIAAGTYRGGIDILINNVGGATVRPGGLASISDDQWRASWDLNVMGVVRPTRAALLEIERRGGGSIVIVSSISAYAPGPNTYDYCAAKAAVANFAKALSKDMALKNIRVNSVSPGAVSSERWMQQGGLADGFAAARGQTADEVRAEFASSAPTGRFTTPEEVADLVVFLASDRAGNITGSDYRIDGGYATTV